MKEWQKDLIVLLVMAAAIAVAGLISGVQLANAGEWKKIAGSDYYSNGDGQQYERIAKTAYRTAYRTEYRTEQYCVNGCWYSRQVPYQVSYQEAHTVYDYEPYEKVNYKEPGAIDRLLGIAERRLENYSKAKEFSDAAKLLGLHDVAAEIHASYPPQTSYEYKRVPVAAAYNGYVYDLKQGNTQYGTYEYDNFRIGDFSWTGLDLAADRENAWALARLNQQAANDYGSSLQASGQELAELTTEAAVKLKALEAANQQLETRYKGIVAVIERLEKVPGALEGIQIESGKTVIPVNPSPRVRPDGASNRPIPVNPRTLRDDAFAIISNHCVGCHNAADPEKLAEAATKNYSDGLPLDKPEELSPRDWGNIHLATAARKMPPKSQPPLSEDEVLIIKAYYESIR